MNTDKWRSDLIRPRARVISDNDYCGDPDGVVQLAHLLLCRSVEVPFVVGSAVGVHHPTWTPDCGDVSAQVARRVAELAGRTDVTVYAGSSTPMVSTTEPTRTAAAAAIVAEAMRDDTDLPLFVLCAGGLTTVASALLIEPRIAQRITIVWNGGHAYDFDPAELPADVRYRETNMCTDIPAAQVVFASTIGMWQVPQDVFATAIVSRSEWLVRVRPHGPLGAHLWDKVGERVDAWSQGLRMGETYGLGDVPLVTLVALGGCYTPEPVSSRWVVRPRPRVRDDGWYDFVDGGAPIRVFTHIDMRLTFEDLYGKLEAHALGLD